jgi:DNA-binding transcriptional LysR family regulator
VAVTLKQLEILNAVVVAGSLSRAARRMALSQPTISQQVAKLEAALGTPLLIRKGAGSLQLTPAGEYWFRRSREVLGEMAAISSQHDLQFSGHRPVLRFGTTPVLQGRFLGAAARIALTDGQFAHCDFLWAASSPEVVELVNLHQLNCAVVTEASVEGHRGSFNVTPLFVDRIAWAVPRSIPQSAIEEALRGGARPSTAHDALTRYVSVRAAPWHGVSEDWYRSHLPYAEPFFDCMSHQSAIDIVAAGLATCQSPLSLFPNLPQSTMDALRLFELEDITRRVVLIMPKHVVSLPPFASFRARLTEFVADHYSKEMAQELVVELPPRSPAPTGRRGARPVKPVAPPRRSRVAVRVRLP